uniref:C-type lectin n=1 Tax=Plectus sambesii TaxID=2011161 RepID=A0A914VKD2_9BILA
MMKYSLLLLFCTFLAQNAAQDTIDTWAPSDATEAYTATAAWTGRVTGATGWTYIPEDTSTAGTSAPPTSSCSSTHCPQECACTPQNIWLDIVLVVDVSNSITADGLLGAKAFLKSIVSALTVSQTPGKTTRVAIVGFAATAQVYKDLGDVISQSDERPTAQNVVFLVTSANQKGSPLDPHPIANQLKSDGTTIITVGYAQSDTTTPPTIDFASPGYNFTNRQPDLFPALGRALCDVNCFCLPRWVQYASGTPGYPQYRKYGECLFLQTLPATWDTARQVCQTMTVTGGYLMDELDADKQYFAKTLATATHPEVQSQGYWTGLNNKDGFWSWDRGTGNGLPLAGDDYSNWMSGYPMAGSAQCVADVKFSGFIMKWKNLPCSSPFTDARVYFCQTRSCDTDNYCG